MVYNEKINQRVFMIILLVSLGIFLRFFVMSFGYNFDFDSYIIVGDIAGHFRNVYEETSRYNYGPVFFCIQGALFRLASYHTGDNSVLSYRVLMVTILTLTDLCIAGVVANRYSIRNALIFFLNPVSIIITGYHNQFDNIAILLALISLYFYNNDERFNKKDLVFILLLSLSLMTKHILFLIPVFILFRKNLHWKKKIVYSCVPPFIFLISFIPFIMNNKTAATGVLNNVFLYRSRNNAPLLYWFYDIVGFPDKYKIIVFMVLMMTLAIITRNNSFENQIMFYLIGMVAFSSAIANQYLAIPMVAFCVLNTGLFKYVYMFFAGIFLILHGDGLCFQASIDYKFPGFVSNVVDWYVSHGYMIAAWILLISIIFVIYNDRHSNRESLIE